MASLWGELKRRNVFRVGVAYLAGVWVLLQVADTVLPSFEASPWVMQALIFSAALGFPLVLVLAWFYELTPEGIKAASEVEAAEAVKFTGRKLDFAIIGLLVLAVGFLIVDHDVLEERDSILPNSVAVLLFDNLSPNPDDAYFAAGVHEQILNELAKIRNLSVIARTSVLQYAGSAKPIPEIARELRVEAVMEGTVRYAGDQIRVTAQLIDGSTGTHLWTEDYDGDLADIFGIQSDIATRIAMALEAELLLDERQRIDKPPTNSPAAWALYLKALDEGLEGHYFGGEAAASTAHSYLDQAIKLDPAFALAYVRKARLYLLGDSTDHDLLAEEYIERALELDRTLGEAHAVFGELNWRSWRLEEARTAYMRALELAPHDPFALVGNLVLNLFLGMGEEAVGIAKRILELDPANATSHQLLGFAYLFAGEPELAIEQLRRASEMEPNLSHHHVEFAFALMAIGKNAEALTEVKITERLLPDDAAAIVIVAYSYSRLGRIEDAARLLPRFQRIVTASELTLPSAQIFAHLAAGENELALVRLKAVADNREPLTFGLMIQIFNVFNDPILEQPEFIKVRRTLGYPD